MSAFEYEDPQFSGQLLITGNIQLGDCSIHQSDC